MNGAQPTPLPTATDLVAWLSTTPMTAARWFDLRMAETGRPATLDQLGTLLGAHRYGAVQAMLIDLRPRRRAVRNALERMRRIPPEPLDHPHAVTLASVVTLDRFAESASGREFEAWSWGCLGLEFGTG